MSPQILTQPGKRLTNFTVIQGGGVSTFEIRALSNNPDEEADTDLVIRDSYGRSRLAIEIGHTSFGQATVALEPISGKVDSRLVEESVRQSLTAIHTDEAVLDPERTDIGAELLERTFLRTAELGVYAVRRAEI